jgi:nitrite reductase/ring-hydroxylating ferredoxin subunit
MTTWHKAAEISALAEKQVIGVEVGDVEIAIFRLEDGYFATSNICTHQFAFLSEGYVEKDCVECPLHQAFFNIRTGAVVDGPPEAPLKTFAVKIVEDDILVALD